MKDLCITVFIFSFIKNFGVIITLKFSDCYSGFIWVENFINFFFENSNHSGQFLVKISLFLGLFSPVLSQDSAFIVTQRLIYLKEFLNQRAFFKFFWPYLSYSNSGFFETALYFSAHLGIFQFFRISFLFPQFFHFVENFQLPLLRLPNKLSLTQPKCKIKQKFSFYFWMKIRLAIFKSEKKFWRRNADAFRCKF